MRSGIIALVLKITALLERSQSLPILLARVVLGVGFLQTGYGKLFKNHAGVVEFFTSLNIPLPAFNAWLVGGVEFFGGILLVVGLGTRLWAVLLAFTMIIATLTTALPKDGLLGSLLSVEVLAMVLLVWLVFSGPGAFSLDHVVKRKLAPPPPAQ